MDKFKEIIDEYLANYDNYLEGKVEFDCIYGELVFNKEIREEKVITLNSIYLYPIYRNKGLCREILIYIIENAGNKFSYFCVESVISEILYSYLLRFKYNNKKFKRVKDGFVFTINK
jgi:hypothetical protein